ncbi:NAD(P)-dependent oxidoreductase, partial [Streptomyces sp. NPDC003442]
MSDQDRPTRPRVGVVGLGAMGLGMARSLRTAGYDVGVHDLRPEVAEGFARDGGTAYASPGDLAAAVDVVVSVVVNAAQVESVLFGADGAADRLRPGAVFVMCSTVDPGWSAELGGRLAERGALYLDAPISGGAARAATGELTMMTSGPATAYAVADPVLEAMSSTVYRLGEQPGLGSKVKIVNQLLAGVHIAVAAEAMALGLKAGVPAEALYEVITHSAASSSVSRSRNVLVSTRASLGATFAGSSTVGRS